MPSWKRLPRAAVQPSIDKMEEEKRKRAEALVDELESLMDEVEDNDDQETEDD